MSTEVFLLPEINQFKINLIVH